MKLYKIYIYDVNYLQYLVIRYKYYNMYVVNNNIAWVNKT